MPLEPAINKVCPDMPTPLSKLNRELDALEGALPMLVADYPDPSDFWPAFAGEADVIEDNAGIHLEHVQHRLNAMLAAHGCITDQSMPGS